MTKTAGIKNVKIKNVGLTLDSLSLDASLCLGGSLPSLASIFSSLCKEC